MFYFYMGEWLPVCMYGWMGVMCMHHHRGSDCSDLTVRAPLLGYDLYSIHSNMKCIYEETQEELSVKMDSCKSDFFMV